METEIVRTYKITVGIALKSRGYEGCAHVVGFTHTKGIRVGHRKHFRALS